MLNKKIKMATLGCCLLVPALSFSEVPHKNIPQHFMAEKHSAKKVEKASVSPTFEQVLLMIRTNQLKDFSPFDFFHISWDKQKFLALLAAVKTNTSIETFLYQDNFISDVINEEGKHDPEILQALCDMLQNNTGIKSFYMNFTDYDQYDNAINTYSAQDLEKFSLAFQKNKDIVNLKIIDLAGSPEFYDSLVNLLSKKEKLRAFYACRLDYYDKGIPEEEFKGIKKLIGSFVTNKSISDLHFRIPLYNEDQLERATEFMDILGEILTQNSSIKSLSLDFAQMGEGVDLTGFMQGLSENKILRDLTLRYPALSDNALEMLLPVLSESKTLKSLTIYGNDFGQEATKELFRYATSSSLNAFEYSNNVEVFTTTEALLELADLLKTNDTLEKLTLKRVGVDDVAATALGQALRTNTKLKDVYIYDEYGREGAVSLASSLEDNHTITDFVLSDWSLTKDERALFEERLKRNRQGGRQ